MTNYVDYAPRNVFELIFSHIIIFMLMLGIFILLGWKAIITFIKETRNYDKELKKIKED